MNRLRHWLIAKLGASCHCCMGFGHGGGWITHASWPIEREGVTTTTTPNGDTTYWQSASGAWDGREEEAR